MGQFLVPFFHSPYEFLYHKSICIFMKYSIDITPNIEYTFSIKYTINRQTIRKGGNAKLQGTKGLQGCFLCQPVALNND